MIRVYSPLRPDPRWATDLGTLTPDHLAEAIHRSGAGESLAAIAPDLGINPQTLNMKLRAAGVTIRPRRGWRNTLR